MPIVHECSEAGCSTLTMGELCLEHEVAATADLVPSDACDDPVLGVEGSRRALPALYATT